ncbi:unnamed protein product, partial [Mesorhabditis belari]|uniref:FERM domain-containing protein n=1 Tax=Mesorhabditis belari TaxID=2138241 RepID=A0AAF3FL92_9BILA
MQIVERCATYGSRFYCVRDGVTDEQLTIAVNSRGIFVYNVGDFLEPVQWFEWKDLDNLFYKETEFILGLKQRKMMGNRPNSCLITSEKDVELQKAVNDPTTK